MKCHYIYDPEVGKVLIPGCMSTAAIGIASCTCRPQHLKKEPHPNDTLVKELEAENARLNRIIKRLLADKQREHGKRKRAYGFPKRRAVLLSLRRVA